MTSGGRQPGAGAGHIAPPPFLAGYAALAEPRIAAFLDARASDAARLPVDLRTAFSALREYVVRNADYVGQKFPEEARKMHYGEIEHRSIYGEASPKDAAELIEEGIELHPMPVLPDDRN